MESFLPVSNLTYAMQTYLLSTTKPQLLIARLPPPIPYITAYILRFLHFFPITPLHTQPLHPIFNSKSTRFTVRGSVPPEWLCFFPVGRGDVYYEFFV